LKRKLLVTVKGPEIIPTLFQKENGHGNRSSFSGDWGLGTRKKLEDDQVLGQKIKTTQSSVGKNIRTTHMKKSP
jgi:hypothetical protein